MAAIKIVMTATKVEKVSKHVNVTCVTTKKTAIIAIKTAMTERTTAKGNDYNRNGFCKYH